MLTDPEETAIGKQRIRLLLSDSIRTSFIEMRAAAATDARATIAFLRCAI